MMVARIGGYQAIKKVVFTPQEILQYKTGVRAINSVQMGIGYTSLRDNRGAEPHG